MKSEKGITLVSLSAYVLAMLMVVSTVSVITSFYYTNVIYVGDSGKNAANYEKFNTYFLKDVEEKGNKVETIGNNGSYIEFSNGNRYTFQDNCLYFNKIRICRNVSEISFQVKPVYDKTIISVLLILGNNAEFSKTTDYVLSY